MRKKFYSIAKNVIGFARKAWNGSPWHILIFCIFAFILLIPSVAHAVLIAEAVGLIFSGLNMFFGTIINILGGLIQWLITPTTFEFVNNDAVRRTWQVMRDFVNLGFVLAIIVIAIGFILRLQTYGSTKTLSRLIIAAILVNFSLVIAGLFIDISALITTTFLVQFQFSQVAKQLLASIGYAQIIAPQSGTPPWLLKAVGFLIRTVDIKADLMAATNVLMRGLLTSIFSITMIAALGALVIMLLIRVARLWFLLVLAPFAWLAWVFPVLEKNWHRWWDEFLRWTFFAPIVVFFLAFSISVIGPPPVGNQPAPPTEFWQRTLAILRDVWNAVIMSGGPANVLAARFFLAIMLIIFSMMVANELSITFSKTAVNWVTVTKWPKTALGRAVGREGGRRFSTSGIGKNLEERFARIPGLGGVADRIRGMRTDIEKDATKLAERYKGLVSSDILSDLANPRKRALMSQAEILARAKAVNDRGDKLPEELYPVIFPLAHRVNPKFAESFLPVNPEAIEYYEKEIAGRRERPRTATDYAARMTPEQASAISVDRLNKMAEEKPMLLTQFALGIRQGVLASLFDSKNSEAAERIVAEIRKTNEALRAAGVSDSEIRRAKNMLKSPNISIYIGGERQAQGGVRETEEELRRAGRWPFQG